MSSNIYTHSEACENPHTNLKGCTVYSEIERVMKRDRASRDPVGLSLYLTLSSFLSLFGSFLHSLSLCFDINSLLSPIRNPSCQSIHVVWHCLRPIGLIFLFLSFSLSVYLISDPGMYTHTRTHICVRVG